MKNIRQFVRAMLDEGVVLDQDQLETFMSWAHSQHLLLSASHQLKNNQDARANIAALAEYDERLNRYRVRINDRIKRLHNIAQAMTEANVEIILIKGLCLSYYIYADLYARDFNDIDLIVSKDNFVKACQVCYELGGESEFDSDYDATFHVETHEVRFTFPEGVLIEIKFTTSSVLNVDAFQRLQQQPTTLVIDKHHYSTLNLEATLLLLLLNIWSSFTQEFAKLKIRDVVDVLLFLRQQSAHINSVRLMNLAISSSLSQSIAGAIEVLIRICETLGTPFPDDLTTLKMSLKSCLQTSVESTVIHVDSNILDYFEDAEKRTQIFHWLAYQNRSESHCAYQCEQQPISYRNAYFGIAIHLMTPLTTDALQVELQCSQSTQDEFGKTLFPYLIIFDDQQRHYRHLLRYQEGAWRILEGHGLLVSTKTRGQKVTACIESEELQHLFTSSHLHYRFFMTRKMKNKQFSILWDE
ncbi:hypothetical protein VHA01S_031_00300 [Vibrio halioticoli NBRC 102217]|uniref:Nucleotidyltransferase family protein n=1 Tax=Vibrio halioticoli NBRC 102217 TaxID=1219072 RepID=V5FEC5_9VIBR|nr:nucleotidyltransferase family protein [Vibrio halioticoli]GAD90018.1 hypothetical protein VHA01S_031_00300 [Vibrio halioticoli NBRC 102217]